MSEKRGYPNPDFTAEDVLVGEPMEIKSEVILDDQMIEYIQKSALFDCLTSAIRSMGRVDDELVQAITGTWDVKEASEAKQYSEWWRQERKKNEELVKENNRMKCEMVELQKQILELLPDVKKVGEEEVKSNG